MRNLSAFQPNGLKQIQLADTALFSDANLDAYYKLEDANDSKNTNHLTNTAVTFSTAKFNNGGVFNGSTAILRLANSFQYTGNFSLSGWVKPTDATAAATQTIIQNELTGTAGGPYSVTIQTSGKLRFSVFATGTGTETYVESLAALSDNTVVFFTCVRDGTNIILYLNGVSNNSTAWSTSQITNASNYFQLGATQNAGGSNFRQLTGWLDDVAIFSKALTAGEVSQLYYAGSTKAYYPLNGNSNDFSGNTNTGTDTAITYPQGRFGQGAKFNGSSSVITASDSASLDITGNLFVSAWISTASYQSGGNAIISKDTYPDTATDRSFLFYLLEGGADTGKLSLIYFKTNAVYKQASSTVRVIKDDKLHLVSASIDVATQTISLFVDGYPVAISTSGSGTADAIQNSTASLKLGDRNGTGHLYHAGIIDEVIIESRAWTAKEVETYYRKSVLNYNIQAGKLSFWESLSNFFFMFFNR